MNLALPAVLIILGMLPGIVFFHSYYSGRFKQSLAGISTTSEAALYIIFTAPLFLIAVGLFGRLGYEVQYDLIGRLLIGGNPADTPAAILGPFLRANGVASAWLYLGTLLTALFLGNLCRRTVWAFRLDVHSHFFRLKHEWFYTITGRLANQPRGVVPSVDIMVERAGKTAIYQGAIVHVEVDKDGQLEQLVLEAARRGKGRGTAFQWIDIPGDRFVVTGESVHSINLRYLVVKKQDPEPDATAVGPGPGQDAGTAVVKVGKLAAAKRWWSRSMVRVVVRSFVFQEN